MHLCSSVKTKTQEKHTHKIETRLWAWSPGLLARTFMFVLKREWSFSDYMLDLAENREQQQQQRCSLPPEVLWATRPAQPCRLAVHSALSWELHCQQLGFTTSNPDTTPRHQQSRWLVSLINWFIFTAGDTFHKWSPIDFSLLYLKQEMHKSHVLLRENH